jgi:hypothetical protein
MFGLFVLVVEGEGPLSWNRVYIFFFFFGNAVMRALFRIVKCMGLLLPHLVFLCG